MKSNKIDKLRFEDYDGTQKCLNLFLFLETLKIKSAVEAADEFSSTLEDEFCSECKSTKSDCDCGNCRDFDRDCDYDDGDRAYDAWKDAQLENEDK